jgi:hypothetical protein
MKRKNVTPGSAESIERLIHTVRHQRVILDSDLAALYGVTTQRLNQQLTRNRKKFPADFAFQLAAEEWEELRSGGTNSKTVKNLKLQNATSSWGHGGRRKPPFVFTEHGALQAANILNSPRAVAMSVYVIRAFVKMREELAANAAILKRLAEIEKDLLLHDSALRDIYEKLQPLLAPPPEPPRPEIGFHIKEDSIPYRIRRKPVRLS